jgi:hypothetical protein
MAARTSPGFTYRRQVGDPEESGEPLSATFTCFRQQLLAAYPAAPLVAVVCDNAIIHRSKLVNRWLAAHPSVLVLHGARYGPGVCPPGPCLLSPTQLRHPTGLGLRRAQGSLSALASDGPPADPGESF